MPPEDQKDRRLVRFLPRHWNKRDSCHRCRKRRPHWHWVLTLLGSMKMLKRVYEAPLLKALDAPNPLLAVLSERENAPIPGGRAVVLPIRLK